jgi:hypothetical protein
MRASPSIQILTAVLAVLAVAAALSGLFWPVEGDSRTHITARGDVVEIQGDGLYRYDSVFAAATFRGTDVITLALGVPFLVASLILYRRGSARGALLLTAAVTYFLYVYATYSLDVAFNELFLVYVAAFAASLFILVTLIRSVDLAAVSAGAVERLPRRGPAAFMFATAAVALVVWLIPVIAALRAGTVPEQTENSSTAVTYALDLAVVVPAALACGGLILRRDALGYVGAFALLGIIVLLGPAIIAQTLWQRSEGVELTLPVVVGPIGGFLVISAAAIWVMASVLRRLP